MALGSADQALGHFRESKQPGREAETLALLARIHLAQERLGPARAVADQATVLAKTTQDTWTQGMAALAQARVLSAEGKHSGAVRTLTAALATTRKEKNPSLDIELRLALGEIEAAHGDRTKGRTLLQQVKAEAERHGMDLIAGKAGRALAGGG